jgi:hypothetical protein
MQSRTGRIRPLSLVSLSFAHLNAGFPVTAAETNGQAGMRVIYCSISSGVGQEQKRAQVRLSTGRTPPPLRNLTISGNLFQLEARSRISSVRPVPRNTGLTNWDSAFEFRKGQTIFLFSRPALGPTQPPIQWIPGALSRSQIGADHTI